MQKYEDEINSNARKHIADDISSQKVSLSKPSTVIKEPLSRAIAIIISAASKDFKKLSTTIEIFSIAIQQLSKLLATIDISSITPQVATATTTISQRLLLKNI